MFSKIKVSLEKCVNILLEWFSFFKIFFIHSFMIFKTRALTYDVHFACIFYGSREQTLNTVISNDFL